MLKFILAKKRIYKYLFNRQLYGRRLSYESSKVFLFIKCKIFISKILKKGEIKYAFDLDNVTMQIHIISKKKSFIDRIFDEQWAKIQKKRKS